ncbi:MAG: DUF2304 domain-containing protein [Pseudomonadota bacterium]
MIQLTVTVIGLCVAVVIIALVRKDRLHVNHGMGWILVAIAFAGLGMAPSFVDHLAAKLGIAYPPALAIIVAISVMVLKMLLMDIDRSQLYVRNQRLTQRIGMLEVEIKRLNDLFLSEVTSGARVPVSESTSSPESGE